MRSFVEKATKNEIYPKEMRLIRCQRSEKFAQTKNVSIENFC